MQNILKWGLLFTLLISVGNAKSKSLPEVTEVISALSLEGEEIQEWIAGMRPDVAIECKPGNLVPFRFLCSYKVFSVKCDPKLAVKIETPFYLRLVDGKIYVSEDLVSWIQAKKFFRGEWSPNIKIGADKSSVVVGADLVEVSESNE